MMQRVPIFVTAPSRSGSSLLVALLNCSKTVAIANEPEIGLTIENFGYLRSVYRSLSEDIDAGFIRQRLVDGIDPTDTFPNDKLAWGRLKVDPATIRCYGVKVSFPAYSDHLATRFMLKEWSNFVTAFTTTFAGRLVVIMRDPTYTIMSWNSTFPRLKGELEQQCDGWNELAGIVDSTRYSLIIVRYEDLVSDPRATLQSLCESMGTTYQPASSLPAINSGTNSIDYYRDARNLDGNTLKIVNYVRASCGKFMEKFGYL